MSLVQAFHAIGFGTGSKAGSFGSSVTAGNLLVLAVAVDGTASPTITAADSQGSYTPVGTYGNGHNTTHFQFFYRLATATGANTVTVTSDSGNDVEFVAHEFNTPSTVLDTHSYGAPTTSTALSSGNITTAEAGELLIGLSVDEGGGHPTLTPGWTLGANGVGNWYFDTEYLVAGAAGSYAATFTPGSGGFWVQAAVVAFKSAAATPAGNATGIAVATATAVLIGAGALLGIANATGSGVAVGAASASGVSTASATAVEIGAASASGVSTATAAGRVIAYSSATGTATVTAVGRVIGAGAASGTGTTGAAGVVVGAASASGVANATAAGSGNSAGATGQANASASGVVLGGASASGVASTAASAREIGAGGATGIASAAASAVVIGSGSATGQANATCVGLGNLATAAGVANATARGVELCAAQASGVANATASGVVAGSGSATGVAVAVALPGGLARPLKVTRVYAGPLIRVTRVQAIPSVTVTRVYAGPLVRVSHAYPFPS